MKHFAINIPKKNLLDPRYRPQVVKNVKGKGTYSRKRDKQLFRRLGEYDKRMPSDIHLYRRGRDRYWKSLDVGLKVCFRNLHNY